MPLKMMLFTNHEAIAATADGCGVDRVVVDLEILGKNERQGHAAENHAGGSSSGTVSADDRHFHNETGSASGFSI